MRCYFFAKNTKESQTSVSRNYLLRTQGRLLTNSKVKTCGELKKKGIEMNRLCGTCSAVCERPLLIAYLKIQL